MTHEMNWNLQNWQSSKSNGKIWNHCEESCSREILQELISDLTLLENFIRKQECDGFQKNEKQYKGSRIDTMKSGQLGKVGLKYTVYMNS